METEQQALKKRVEELTVELERLKSESSRVTGALQQVKDWNHRSQYQGRHHLHQYALRFVGP